MKTLPSEQPNAPASGLTPPLIALFALATGLMVASLYYSQPLLPQLATHFGVGTGPAARLVTDTQLGYALGLALIVPLGDIVNRRRLTLTLLGLSILSLLGAACAGNFAVFGLFSVQIGLTSVGAQVLVPFAATLAEPVVRGRVVGVIMSGLLLGILLARTVSGLIAAAWTWESVYLLAAAALALLWVALWKLLPSRAPESHLSYSALLTSVGQLFISEPTLRRRSLYGIFGFAAFSVFWTSLAFLLAGPPFHYNEAGAGLFGLLGAAGALAASWAGRWADAGYSRLTTGVFALILMLSFGFVALGAHSLPVLIIGVLLLDLGVQGLHVTNQSEIYRLRPESRSRLATVYLSLYFSGGIVGSALSSLVYVRWGWNGECVLGGLLGALILLGWATEKPLLSERAPCVRKG